MSALRVGILLRNARYLEASPAMSECLRMLAAQGVTVEMITPDVTPIDVRSIHPDCDLYLLKPGSEINLSLAGVLEARGARVLNDYRASALTQDKLQVTARLIDANLPVPESFVCGNAQLAMALAGLVDVFVKPHRGSYGEGVRSEHYEGLESVAARSGVGAQFMQAALSSDGFDTKVYVIGDEVFAIKRPFPAVTLADKMGRPCAVTDKMRSLALAVGRLLRLTIYGIDMLETPDGLYIIDVNFFPSYIGVSEAPAALTRFIVDYASRLRRTPARSTATPLQLPLVVHH